MRNIYFIVIILILILYVARAVLKSKLNVKESFFWLVGSILALLLAIFPKSIDSIASLVGIGYPPALLFIICIIFLLFMNFRDSRRIAEQQTKITELAQQIAILKEKMKK